ncbi:unnamed protein product [Cuscuta epithymum]|uniref:DUF4220 domain-containing protein n=1 Tax=Cuscuta epithymum TaxID=186058 RepID=A0AAV0D6Z5_9ASTE|nr:unnamed protein product [Cuscuta epithymum]
MKINTSFILSFYFMMMMLATTHANTLKAIPKATIYGYDVHLDRIIPLCVVIVILGVIAVVLFKKGFIDSYGLTLALWTLLLFASEVLDAWDVRAITFLLILIHILVNLFGLLFWIRLSVTEYTTKKTWPSSEMLFQVGVWFVMFVFSWIEYTVRRLLGNDRYYRVYQLYPIGIALVTMVENYWSNRREIFADQSKLRITENMTAFDDLVRACAKLVPSGNISELNQKWNDFTEVFFALVAQRREAFIVLQQRSDQQWTPHTTRSRPVRCKRRFRLSCFKNRR